MKRACEWVSDNWKGWAFSSIVAGILVLGCFIGAVTLSALDESDVFPNSPAGLLESISIFIGWGWIALLALRLQRQMRPSVLPAHASSAVGSMK